MPRDIGPDLLRNLENQLALGNIDQATYDTRRAEVMEMIRKGKAVEFGTAERVLIGLAGVVAVAFGIVMLGGLSSSGGGNIFGLLLILAAFGGGLTLLARALRGTK